MKAPIELGVRPNPIQDVAFIDYDLPESTRLNIRVYNSTGQLVKTLANIQQAAAGQHTLRLDAADLPGGIYYLNFQSGSGNVTKKMMITK